MTEIARTVFRKILNGKSFGRIVNPGSIHKIRFPTCQKMSLKRLPNYRTERNVRGQNWSPFLCLFSMLISFSGSENGSFCHPHKFCIVVNSFSSKKIVVKNNILSEKNEIMSVITLLNSLAVEKLRGDGEN